MNNFHAIKTVWRIFAALTVLMYSTSNWADRGDTPPQIDLLLISRDKAVIQVNGKTHRLHIGESSPESVQLISLGVDEATFLYGERTIPVRLSRSYGLAPPSPGQRLHQVYADSQGMYRTMGAINGKPVNFVVDTGATYIFMSAREADRLGIDYRRHGKPSHAQTASSIVQTYNMRLNQVQVGEIIQYSVEASVVKGDFPRTPLLGMSFLQQLDMQRQSNMLTLRQLD